MRWLLALKPDSIYSNCYKQMNFIYKYVVRRAGRAKGAH